MSPIITHHRTAPFLDGRHKFKRDVNIGSTNYRHNSWLLWRLFSGDFKDLIFQLIKKIAKLILRILINYLKSGSSLCFNFLEPNIPWCRIPLGFPRNLMCFLILHPNPGQGFLWVINLKRFYTQNKLLYFLLSFIKYTKLLKVYTCLHEN